MSTRGKKRGVGGKESMLDGKGPQRPLLALGGFEAELALETENHGGVCGWASKNNVLLPDTQGSGKDTKKRGKIENGPTHLSLGALCWAWGKGPCAEPLRGKSELLMIKQLRAA